MEQFEAKAPVRDVNTSIVRPEDFRAVEGRLGLWGYDLPLQEAVDSWNKYIPFSPVVAETILNDGLPPGSRVLMALTPEGAASISYDILGFSDSVGAFDVTKKTSHITNIQRQPDKSAPGSGRILARNMIEFFRAVGVKKVELDALGAGSYVWAKMGFLPTGMEWPDFDDGTRRRVDRRYEFFKAAFPTDVRQKIESHMGMKRPEDLWVIADCDYDMGPFLKDKFNIAAGNTGKTLQSLYLAFDELIGQHIAKDVLKGSRVTVGRVLMAATSWHGVLDFSNEGQMMRAADYVGGWRTFNLS